MSAPLDAGCLSAWRTTLGRSAELWAGAGDHVVGDGWWMAMSGAPSVDYNVLVVHDGEVTAGISHALDTVAGAAVPALIMVAGRGLAGVDQLAQAGWVCVGATPFMVADLTSGRSYTAEAEPAVRPLAAEELGSARGLIADAFDLDSELAAVALPDTVAEKPHLEAWGLFEQETLACCVSTASVDGALAVWSMGTPRSRQRAGLGRRLLAGVLGAAAGEGLSRSLLYASPAGIGLYRSLGYEVLEYWQLWSRPRWVLGRA